MAKKIAARFSDTKPAAAVLPPREESADEFAAMGDGGVSVDTAPPEVADASPVTIPADPGPTYPGASPAFAAMMVGRSVPPPVPKEGVDPLVIDALNLLEKFIAAGIIPTWCEIAMLDASQLTARIRRERCV